MQGYLFVYIGTSKSSRKDIAHTVARDLGLQKVVKYSSRQPRVGEVEGIDQHFVSHDELNRLANIGIVTDIIENDRREFFGISRAEVVALTSGGRSAYVTVPDPVPGLVEAFGDRVVRIFTYTKRDSLRQKLMGAGDAPEVIATKLRQYDRKWSFSKECEHVVHNEVTLDTILKVKDIVSAYLQATDLHAQPWMNRTQPTV